MKEVTKIKAYNKKFLKGISEEHFMQPASCKDDAKEQTSCQRHKHFRWGQGDWKQEVH